MSGVRGKLPGRGREGMMHLRSVDPDQNRYRWYSMSLQYTIMGGVDLVCRWGRIGSQGRGIIYPFSDLQEARKGMARIARRRFGHGYSVSG